MLIKKMLGKLSIFVVITASFAAPSTVVAESYSPYPGILPAKLVSVSSASSIDVSTETWPGFSRTFSVSLAGVELPENSDQVKLCQRKLAEKAQDFVKDYLVNAAKIELHHLTMQNSSDRNVEADIFTEQGSLSNALKSRGLARAIATVDEAPWC